MNAFSTRIGNAVVVLGVSGLVVPRSAWAIGPAVHGSVGSSSYLHAPSQTVQPSSSHAYTHPSSSGNSVAKSTMSASSALRTVHNTTNVTGSSTTPKNSKVNGTSSQTTITSSSGTVGSTNASGNLIFKRNVKNPTGASTTLPTGGGHVLEPTTPASMNVMDGTYSKPSSIGDVINDILGGIFHPDAFKAEPQPVVPTKIWSGSSNLASGADVNAKGTPEKPSVELAKGKQVQNHLDKVARVNDPAGELKKGKQIQKHLDDVATAYSPAGKLKKGEQIQKQISSGTSNASPNP